MRSLVAGLTSPEPDQLGRERIDIRDTGTTICDVGAVEFQPGDG